MPAAAPCYARRIRVDVQNARSSLRGTINRPREHEESPGIWRVRPSSNRRDQKPLQQADRTARTRQTWLASMRARIQGPDQP